MGNLGKIFVILMLKLDWDILQSKKKYLTLLKLSSM